jgi:enolase
VIADLVVAAKLRADQEGVAARSGPLAKHCQPLHIEEELGTRAAYSGAGAFAR